MISIIVLITGLYSYDPLQIFHKPWGRDITFHKNMRLQVAGIANNYEFDSIIIGSSMMENTSAQEVNDKLDGDFINISLSGSTYYERLLVMKHIFRKKSIKNVLYSLDAGSYIHQQKAYESYPLETFKYLYDENIFNDFRAYFNINFLKCLVTISKNTECIGENITLDRPNAWFEEERHKMRFGGLNHWFNANNNKKIKSALRDIVSTVNKIKSGEKISLNNINNNILKAQKYVDKTIINFVKNNPDTHFIMFFPPYSRMHYAWWAQHHQPYFEIHKTIIKYLVEKSEIYPNLKIYGFEDHDFLDDIANYKDGQHYHYSIDSWILSEIEHSRGELTKNNLVRYLDTITEKAQTYDIITIGEKIDTYLQNN